MRVSRFCGIAVVGFVFAAAGAPVVGAADHPGSGSDCVGCHGFTAQGAAPKVVPTDPAFLTKLFEGKVTLRGHATLRCAGTANDAGQVTGGCHRPESGFPKGLAVKLSGIPSDELCGKCHPNQRMPGRHHPSYKKDENGDGVPEKIVRPPAGQEVFTAFAPASQTDPLKTYPDAATFTVTPDGRRVLGAAIPLATVIEKDPATNQDVEVSGVVTCVSCHNPHYGYLVEVGTAEGVQAEYTARKNGDVLLRMRDRDNALCLTCH